MNFAQQASRIRRWNSRASFSLTRSRTAWADYASGVIIEGLIFGEQLVLFIQFIRVTTHISIRMFHKLFRDWPWSLPMSNTGLNTGYPFERMIEDWWKILGHTFDPWNSSNLKNIPERVSSSLPDSFVSRLSRCSNVSNTSRYCYLPAFLRPYLFVAGRRRLNFYER